MYYFKIVTLKGEREGGRERERVYSVTKGGRGVLITIHDSSSILFKD